MPKRMNKPGAKKNREGTLIGMNRCERKDNPVQYSQDIRFAEEISEVVRPASFLGGWTEVWI